VHHSTDVRQPSSVVVGYRTRGFVSHRARPYTERRQTVVFSRSVRHQSRQTSGNRRRPPGEARRSRRSIPEKLGEAGEASRRSSEKPEKQAGEARRSIPEKHPGEARRSRRSKPEKHPGEARRSTSLHPTTLCSWRNNNRTAALVNCRWTSGSARTDVDHPPGYVISRWIAGWIALH